MSYEACMEPSEIEKHLAFLRKRYIESLPKQRLSIAKQRIKNPEHDPNRLIAFVSAVEGFARSLCMHQCARTKAEVSAIYPEYSKRSAKSLIVEYLNERSLGEASSHFGERTWQLFGYAVQYRNLLAHECTYLGSDKSQELIEACRAVLRVLAKDEGLNADDI